MRRPSRIIVQVLVSAIVIAGAVMGFSGCSNDSAVKEETGTGGSGGAGGAGGVLPDAGVVPNADGGDTGTIVQPDSSPDAVSPSDCVLYPTTHEEIINSCTQAVRIDKRPVLPRLGPNGELPPLP
jgi:hypothetical protein